MATFNPLSGLGYSTEQIKQAMLAAVGAQSEADFDTKWRAWQASQYDDEAPGRGQDALSDFIDNVIDNLPDAGTRITPSVRTAMLSSIQNSVAEADLADVAAGVAPGLGGNTGRMLTYGSESLGRFFGSGGNQAPAMAEQSFFGTLGMLKQRYDEAIGKGDDATAQGILSTLRSPAILNQIQRLAGTSFGGNAARNVQRALQRAMRSTTGPQAGEHFWDAIGQFFPGLPRQSMNPIVSMPTTPAAPQLPPPTSQPQLPPPVNADGTPRIAPRPRPENQGVPPISEWAKPRTFGSNPGITYGPPQPPSVRVPVYGSPGMNPGTPGSRGNTPVIPPKSTPHSEGRWFGNHYAEKDFSDMMPETQMDVPMTEEEYLRQAGYFGHGGR